MTALNELIDATRSLFHQLKAVAREVHGGGELTAGTRGVLQDLHRHGARTVPDMARSRPVSRQHIQTLVNTLLRDGSVELRDNPLHRRSRLVALTPRGRDRVVSMLKREGRVLSSLPVDVTAAEMRKAAAVLQTVRASFRGDAWEAAVEGD